MTYEPLSKDELTLLLGNEPDNQGGVTDPFGSSHHEDVEPSDFHRLEGLVRQSLLPAAQAWSVLFGEPVVLDSPKLSLVTLQALEDRGAAQMVGCRVEFQPGEGGMGQDSAGGTLLWVIPDQGSRTLANLVPGGRMNRGAANDLAQALAYLQVEFRSNLLRHHAIKIRTSPLQLITSIPEYDENYFQIMLELKISTRWAGPIRFLVPVPVVRELLRLDCAAVSLATSGEEFEGLAADEWNSEPPVSPVSSRLPREHPPSQFLPPIRLLQEPPVNRIEETGAEDGQVVVELGQVVVELGTTYLPEAHSGRLVLGETIELDRLAGESVDIRLDRRLVARGEITVVGETLAVRVTHLIDSGRRPLRAGSLEDGSPNRGHS